MFSACSDGRRRNPSPGFHRRNPPGLAGGSGNGCSRQSALPGSVPPSCRCERGIESTSSRASFRAPRSRSHLSAPTRGPIPHCPVIPPLIFRLDVSNYYVILTLTILGPVDFLGFSNASLPQER